ncbi:GNAT family N-acetyltransferase [Dactylosporangium sp. NPDC051485]|uniref:GNAT family N-acetyltransferase n=1 Tax=Dactylosporangium sp. NPDC051485 TaxID=3154846 RepID=UPI00342A860E
MQPVIATEADVPAWLFLAEQVEDLFGPLVEDPGFRAALLRNIGRGTALCVRVDAAASRAALAGGLLLSAHHPTYQITWLAVSREHRGDGIGELLVRTALDTMLEPPCAVEVTTFGPDHPGHAARGFYEHLGFEPASAVTADGARQTYRLQVPRS